MKIYRSAVQRPVTTLMVFVAIVGFGLFSLQDLPIDLYPEIEPPIISVITEYPGASASDIETTVTRPLEDNLSIISDLDEINSVSRDDVSTIVLEFQYGTNLDEAANEIRDVLGRIGPFLPDDAEQPMVFKFSAAMIPVVVLAATADESYPALAKIIEDRVVNPLQRIEGVGNIMVTGEPVREIQVNVDPEKLDSYGLTVEEVGGVLASENVTRPAGNIKMGLMDYPLRFTGEFEEARFISDLVIGSFNGNNIFVRDVAEVKDTLRELTVEERLNQERGLRLVVQRQSGANTVQIAREILDQLPAIRENLPPDVELLTIVDLSEFIIDAVDNLTNILYFAAIFVTVVVLFFIGRWRATFIIVLTIPVSLVAAFIYLYVTGNSLNIISLSSLTIAMGMVVDDAIVVLENATKHIERGSHPREAALYGTNEVGMAVVASTLTVLAVFLPLTLIPGLIGLFFRQLGFIVAITVSVSTLAALTLTPMLSSRLMAVGGGRSKGFGTKTSAAIERFLENLDNGYESLLNWALGRKRTIFFGAVLIFFASIGLFPLIGTSFMPEADQNRLDASIELPVGLRLEETVKTARVLEQILEEKFPEVDLYSISSGADPTMGIFGAADVGSHTIDMTMRLIPVRERERSVWQLAEALRQELQQFPEIVNFTVETEGGGGMGMGAPVEVEIYGEDFTETGRIARELADRMEAIEGLRDVRLSRGPERPELQVIPDQEKMASFGLNAATVSSAIRNRVDGMTATLFREAGEEYDVVVRHKEDFRESISHIENISVRNQRGELVKLKEFARVEEYFSPPSIERKNRVRYITVSSSLHERSLGDATADISAELDEMDLPEGINVDFGGQIEEQQEAFADLFVLLILSIFLVYVVMAAQFESFRMPAIIMLAVPFAFSGVMLALFITGTELSVISIIGGIILIGIVVKNSIVLIDFTNLMYARGLGVVEAVVTAGRSRLRPVLMTALTTLLAMIPMVLARGEGAEIWAPMAIAVIGGLFFSTLITLIFVPVAYGMFGAKKLKKKKEKEDQAFLRE